jgi:hypothetical protein
MTVEPQATVTVTESTPDDDDETEPTEPTSPTTQDDQDDQDDQGTDSGGDGHRRVVLRGGAVDGNVQLEDGRTAGVLRVDIDGDLQSEDNRGRQVLRDNRIDGNLNCEDNRPGPRGGGEPGRGRQGRAVPQPLRA